MRRWRKGLVWLAGIVITGSLASGAVAADVTTTITLEDSGGCTASLTNGTIDLGTWQWNGSRYVRTGDTVATLGGDVTVEARSDAYGDTHCDVTLKASDLEQDEGDGVIAGVLELRRTNSGNPISFSLSLNNPVSVEVVVPSNLGDRLATVEPGTYSGTITVSTGEAPGT